MRGSRLRSNRPGKELGVGDLLGIAASLLLGAMFVFGSPVPDSWAQAPPSTFVEPPAGTPALALIGKVLEVDIEREVIDRPVPECKNFKLNRANVKTFFAHSKSITSAEMDYGYWSYPCWYEGRVKTEKGEFSWLIQAGGTGGYWVNDGDTVYLICGTECKDFFVSIGRRRPAEEGARNPMSSSSG